MPANLAAFIYLSLALSAAAYFVSSYFNERTQDIKNIFFCWVTMIGLVFFIPFSSLYFLLSAFALATFCPKSTEGRALFYAGMLPAIPSFVLWSIPFPAINRLFDLNYFILLNLIVLSPVIFSKKSEELDTIDKNQAFSLATKSFFLAITFFIVTILLDFRDTTFTNGLRKMVETFLSTVLLLLAAKTIFTSKKAIDECLFGLLIGAVFVAFIGIVQQLKGWTFFQSIPMDLPIKNDIFTNIKNYRSGFMRIGSTMNPIPYGFFMAIGIGILCYFRDKSRPNILFYGLITALASGIIFSDSRAAILCLIVIMSGKAIFPQKLNAALLLLVFIIIPGIFIFSFIDLESILLNVDTYGTFQYRLNLIENSMIVVADNLLFGDKNFMQHPALEASRQGQGIIDIVNAYLQILLPYGLVGLSLFSAAFLLILKALGTSFSLSKRNTTPPLADGLLAAILVAALVLMATVSMTDRLPHLLWLFYSMTYGHIYWTSTKNTHDS